MKLRLEKDEVYPVYFLSESSRVSPTAGAERQVQLSDDDYADYLRVGQAWQAWQDKLEKL